MWMILFDCLIWIWFWELLQKHLKAPSPGWFVRWCVQNSWKHVKMLIRSRSYSNQIDHLPETPLLEKLRLNCHTDLKAVPWEGGVPAYGKRWHAAWQSRSSVWNEAIVSWQLRAQPSWAINKLNHKFVACVRTPEQFISNLTSRPTAPATTMNSGLGGLSVPPQRHLAASRAPEIIGTAARGCRPATGGQLLEGLAMLVIFSGDLVGSHHVTEWDGGSPAV